MSQIKIDDNVSLINISEPEENGISCGVGTTLNETTNECKADVTQADLDAVNAELLQTQAALLQAQTDIDSALATVATLQSELDSVNAQILTLEGDLTQAQSDLDASLYD